MKQTISFAVLAAVLCVGSCLFAECPNATPEGENLFAGKTLDDFDAFLVDDGQKDKVFKLEDGILKISGTPFGWLAPKGKTYKNFTLRTEIRHPNSSERANSGLFLHIMKPTETFLPHCLEVQMQTGNVGAIFSFHGEKLSGDADRTSQKSNQVGGDMTIVNRFQSGQIQDPEVWNKVEVTCFESLVFVRVNGVLVNWAYGVEPQAGQLGFQSEGGEVWYRNAYIVEEKTAEK